MKILNSGLRKLRDKGGMARSLSLSFLSISPRSPSHLSAHLFYFFLRSVEEIGVALRDAGQRGPVGGEERKKEGKKKKGHERRDFSKKRRLTAIEKEKKASLFPSPSRASHSIGQAFFSSARTLERIPSHATTDLWKRNTQPGSPVEGLRRRDRFDVERRTVALFSREKEASDRKVFFFSSSLRSRSSSLSLSLSRLREARAENEQTSRRSRALARSVSSTGGRRDTRSLGRQREGGALGGVSQVSNGS